MRLFKMSAFQTRLDHHFNLWVIGKTADLLKCTPNNTDINLIIMAVLCSLEPKINLPRFDYKLSKKRLKYLLALETKVKIKGNLV